MGACSWAKNIGNEAKKPSEKTRRRLLHTREVDYLELDLERTWNYRTSNFPNLWKPNLEPTEPMFGF